MFVRRETPADAAAIRAVHQAAFGAGRPAPAPEATLVDQLRADGAVVPPLSLLAEVDGTVVGHVVCSRGSIGATPSLGLGPLGVRPEHQRRGVGSALMHAVLGAADALDEPAVVLLGHATYYPRFGFVPAVPLGVTPPDPAWAPNFFIRTLRSWPADRRGPFRYAAAFDRLG